VKNHGITPILEHPLFSDFVDDFSEIERIELPSAHTVLLLAVDASSVPVETITRIANKLLKSGLIWICVWGPDCERVVYNIDISYSEDSDRKPAFPLMSTWHSDEPLEEAIWFFLNCAIPFGEEIKKTSHLAITVGNTSWNSTINNALSDVSAFSTNTLKDEE
jgi:hypothetical protein